MGVNKQSRRDASVADHIVSLYGSSANGIEIYKALIDFKRYPLSIRVLVANACTARRCKPTSWLNTASIKSSSSGNTHTELDYYSRFLGALARIRLKLAPYDARTCNSVSINARDTKTINPDTIIV